MPRIVRTLRLWVLLGAVAFIVSFAWRLPLLAAAAAATNTLSLAQYEEEARYCPQPWPFSFTESVSFQQRYFAGVNMDQWGSYFYIDGVPYHRYKVMGNYSQGLTVDNTRKWQWLNGTVRARCDIHYFPPLEIEHWVLDDKQGTLVPYGDEEAADTLPGSSLPPGYGGSEEDPMDYWVCWKYSYPDGTYSEYFYCERLS